MSLNQLCCRIYISDGLVLTVLKPFKYKQYDILLSKAADVALTSIFSWLEQEEAKSETSARIPKSTLSLRRNSALVQYLPPSLMEIGQNA